MRGTNQARSRPDSTVIFRILQCCRKMEEDRDGEQERKRLERQREARRRRILASASSRMEKIRGTEKR